MMYINDKTWYTVCMTIREKELERELAQAYEALTHVQARGTELINECRALKREKERLKAALMKLITSSYFTGSTNIPSALAGKLEVCDEDRPNGEPVEIEQREEGYEPPPLEQRRSNGITKERGWK